MWRIEKKKNKWKRKTNLTMGYNDLPLALLLLVSISLFSSIILKLSVNVFSDGCGVVVVIVVIIFTVALISCCASVVSNMKLLLENGDNDGIPIISMFISVTLLFRFLCGLHFNDFIIIIRIKLFNRNNVIKILTLYGIFLYIYLILRCALLVRRTFR